MTDVFISHVKADRKLIRRIVKALEAEGFELWYEQNTAPDGKWTPALQRALVDAAAIITCWSEEAAASDWVKAEASHAKDRNALITVTVEACKIPQPFRDLKSPDFSKWRGDTDDPDWVAIIKRIRELMLQKSQIGAQPVSAPAIIPAPAPRPVAAPAPVAPPPPEPAAQVVAPSAFFSANLGGPAVARGGAAPGRAAPLPQTPAPARPMRPPPPPMPPAGEAPRALRPEPPQPAPQPPRRVQPIDTPAAPPTRNLHPIDTPPAPPPQRAFQPIDEPKQPAPQPRPAPRAIRPVEDPPRIAPAPRAAEPPRYTEQPRFTEPPPRKRGGAARFMMLLLVVGVLGGGGYWAYQQFVAGGDQTVVADSMSVTPPDQQAPIQPETQIAAAPEEAQPVEEAPIETTATPLPTPAAAPQEPRPQTPPATSPPRAPNIVRASSAAEPPPTPAAPTDQAQLTRQLDQCLSRLVRMCPGSANAPRPGFNVDGSLSSAERALLRQRGLFQFPEMLDNSLQVCERHLSAGQTGPLINACGALQTAGPPS